MCPIINCLCTDDVEAPENDQCSDGKFGPQPVRIFLMKGTGVDFDGTTPYTAGTKGGTISTPSDWQLRMALTSSDDKIIILDVVGTKPAADSNTLKDNDVQGGGEIAIDRPQELDLKLFFPNANSIKQANQAQCWPSMKIAYLDNRNNLYADKSPNGAFIASVYALFGTLEHAGIGTKPNISLKLKWNNLCMPEQIVPPTPGGFAFLRTIKLP